MGGEGDEQTVASFFRLNPHFSFMALPIVQQISSDESLSGQQFLHWYRAERRREPMSRVPVDAPSQTYTSPQRSVEVLSEDFHVLPILEHVQTITKTLRHRGIDLHISEKLQHLKINNSELVGLVATSSSGYEFMFFTSIDYPTVAPIVIYQRYGKTNNLRPQWDGISDLLGSLRQVAELLSEEWPSAATSDPHNTIHP